MIAGETIISYAYFFYDFALKIEIKELMIVFQLYLLYFGIETINR